MLLAFLNYFHTFPIVQMPGINSGKLLSFEARQSWMAPCVNMPSLSWELQLNYQLSS